MENREDILDALTNFEKKPSGEIPELLEEYLRQVAKSGETIYPWHCLKRLFVSKLDHVIMEFYHETPADSIPTYPNVDSVPFDDMRKRILDALEKFHGAPFTVQRICELITDPRRHYKRSDKFLRGIEKNVMVVSTVDPFGRKIVSEPSKVMVNGLDVNGHENEKLNKKRTNEEPLPQARESENSPSWTPDYGAISVWPKTNSPGKQISEKNPTGEDIIKVSLTNSSNSIFGDSQNQNLNAKLSDGDEVKTDDERSSKKTQPECEPEESVPGKDIVIEQDGSKTDSAETDETINKDTPLLEPEKSSLETSASSDDGTEIVTSRNDSTDDQKQDEWIPHNQSDGEGTQNNGESDSDSNARPEGQKSTQSSGDESSGDGQPTEAKVQWVSGPSEVKSDAPDNLTKGDVQQTFVKLEENENQSEIAQELPDSSSSQVCSLSQEASEKVEKQSQFLSENIEQAEEINSTLTNATAEMMDMDNCENVDSETPMDNSADDTEHQTTNLDNTGANLTENQSSDEPMEQE